jgi:hypothetical protein
MDFYIASSACIPCDGFSQAQDSGRMRISGFSFSDGLNARQADIAECIVVRLANFKMANTW